MSMNGWLSILILHLVRSNDVITRALERVEPSDIMFMSDRTTAYIWATSREYFRKYHRPIPQVMMESKMADYMNEASLSDAEVEEMANVLAWVYSIPETDLEPKEGITYIETLLSHTRIESVMQAKIAEGAPIKEILQHMNDGAKAATVSVLSPVNVLDNYMSVISQSRRKPIGGNDIMYFNKLLSGGILPGEVCVIQGPTGGYKTTMAIDIVCSMATVNQESVYLAYEQSLKTVDIPLRFMVRLTGLPKTRFTEMDEASPDKIVALSPEEITKLDYAKDNFSDKIHFYDCSDITHKVSDIKILLQDLIASGKRPKVIVLDQLLSWVEKQEEAKKRPDMMRKLTLNMLQELKTSVAEQLNIAFIVLHQMTANLVGGNSHYKPKGSDSAEVKGVAQWIDFQISLGNVDKATQCLWAITTKHRGGQYVEMILHGDGNYSRIRDANWMKESENRPGYFIERGSDNTLSQAPKSNRMKPFSSMKSGV